jgi:predicted ATPase
MEPPRIDRLTVRNYRALQNVELKNITPLTALLGPNGSGKSTVFDVFAFLSECFESGLRRAWEKRGRAKELKTRGSSDPVTIEIQYREQPGASLMAYRLTVDERKGVPEVLEERLERMRDDAGAPFRFLEHKEGHGLAVFDERNGDPEKLSFTLTSPDLIAVNALGQLAEHPRIAALRHFITGWYVSCLSAEDAKGQAEIGPQERLSRTGDNLANVIQYLAEQHPERLERIFEALRASIPCIESVSAEPMPGDRLLLQIKDAPFELPIPARFASDGTLKMLAYLVLLQDPVPPSFIGIEEPENFLHPRLLPSLGEECRAASERGQVLVTTHSPFYLNALRPEEVRILYRDERGYTQAVRAQDIQGVPEFTAAGALLGDLWLEGHLGAGDPLTNHGVPVRRPTI